ncbi:clostripain-related cysteine peptidase, partial [Chloroflexota bacterium]
TDANYYYVEQDSSDNITSPVEQSLGEVNMGDPNTLVNFVTWATTNYPAEKYALVLWDHGSGWKTRELEPQIKGVCFDDTSSGDRITTLELGTALSQIQSGTGVTLDIVGFDACLMQMLEVAYQIRDYANVMVASEEVEPWDGWPYDDILGYLTSNPTWGTLALSNAIVTTYIDSYSVTDYVTQSAIDLTQVGVLKTAVDQFATAMIASGNADAIWSAKFYTEHFDDPDYLDLFDFADKVITYFPPSSNVSVKAEAVKEAVKEVVVAEAHHSQHPNANGISIYVPYATYNTNYDSLVFATDTQWDEFLNWILTDGGTEPPWTEIITDGSGEGPPDIQGVDVALDPESDMGFFRVRSNGALNFADLWGLTLLDTDSDNATGYDGSFALSQNDIGADYMVEIYTPGTRAPEGINRPQREERQTLYCDLYQWYTENVTANITAGFYWVTEVFSFTDSNYYWFGIFLSDMGYDTGPIDVVQWLGISTTSTLTDIAPDTGHGAVIPPEPLWWALMTDPPGEGPPDITEVDVSLWPDEVFFKVIANGFDFNNFRAFTYLDTDTSNTTGLAINDTGADFMVCAITSGVSEERGLHKWNSADEFWEYLAPVDVYANNTSFWFEVLASDLGGAPVNMDVVQHIGTMSTQTDTAPDTGYAYVGEPEIWNEILTDNISDQWEGPGPDIVAVDSSLTDNMTDNITIAFRVRTNETIDFYNFAGLTALDTDQNPETPSPDEGGGFEYYVFVGTQIPGVGVISDEPSAMLIHIFGPGEMDWEYVCPLPLFTDNTSYWTIVPLSLLGDDDGAMDVMQLVGTLTTPDLWTDSAPDMASQPPQPPETVEFGGLIDDPTGDGDPDIHWVGSFREPDKVGFMIKGDFDASDLKAATLLDIDQDPETGDPINDIGADYQVMVYTGASLNATLQSWNGTAWIDVGPVTVMDTDNTSYFWFEIPLSDLGNDQGNMDVVQGIGTLTEKTDTAPDEGHRSIGEPEWIELFSDPTGDSTGIGPDLVGVDAERHWEGIAFRVRAEGIDFDNLWGMTCLDVDSDNTTGELSNDIGAEYRAIVRSTGESMPLLEGTLMSWNGTEWQQVEGLGVYTDGDYYWFWLDFGQLGGDDGEMDIVQLIGPLTPEEWSDKAPDEGHGSSPPRRVEDWWDSIKDEEGDGYPDIHCVDANREPDRVAFRVEGAFDANNLRAGTWIDIDQNPETGDPINDIGADYNVKVYTATSLDGLLASWNGTDWEHVGPVTVVTDNTSYFWFAIPLSDLGDDQGNMDVVQTIGISGTETDKAPDDGHGTIGEPPWAELFDDPTGEGTPDIVAVDLARHEGGIHFRVRANSDLNFDNLFGKTYLDVDSDNTTGKLVNDIGADYVARVTTGASLDCSLGSWNGTTFEDAGGFGVYTDGNYYWFGLGYNELVNPDDSEEDGIMDVVQVIGNITPGVETDRSPDTGHGTIAPRATVEEAIDDSIAWLASQQNADGSWGTKWQVAKTGMAVLKLETHALSDNISPFDPLYEYSDNVSKGLDYLFANASTTGISGQPAGNPDSDSDGIGVYFRSPGEEGEPQIYETSIVMMVIASSNTTDREVNVPGSPVDGWTYEQVLEDMVDYIAWAQTDWGFGQGGWNYGPMDNVGDRSDQSISGYATLGLAYAESPPPFGFGLPIPGFVRSELDIWIDYIQDDVDGDEHDGGSYYTGPSDPDSKHQANILRTGNLLQQMAFVGDNVTTPRVQDAIDYLVRHWDDHPDPGWKGWPSDYQATFTTMKGLEAFNADNITSGETTINWFQEFKDVLVWEQNPDGSWPQCNHDDGEQIL